VKVNLKRTKLTGRKQKKINVKCCENFNNILLLLQSIRKLDRNDNGKFLQRENVKTEGSCP
jgi:hypothetical protein